MKKSKQTYYDQFFERNLNNVKNTWKGIKSLISLKTVASSVPTVLSLDNGDTFNNYLYSWNYKKKQNFRINIFQTHKIVT